MLIFSPIITAVCIYTAVTYGILYLLFTTFTFVFSKQYGFNTGTTGLTFIPLGIGMILSLGIMGVITDKRIKAKQLAKEEVKPEDRIPIDIVLTGALCLPIGLFIYGWTVQYKIHWIVPLIGTSFVGFGLLIIFVRNFTLYHIRLNTNFNTLDGHANIFSRRLYDLCGVCYSCKYGSPIITRWITPPFWTESVYKDWVWMGR
jgi:hypothetical protein